MERSALLGGLLFFLLIVTICLSPQFDLSFSTHNDLHSDAGDNLNTQWMHPTPLRDAEKAYANCESVIPQFNFLDPHLPASATPQEPPFSRLPLVPLRGRNELGCLVELFGFKRGAELGTTLLSVVLSVKLNQGTGVQKGGFSYEVLSRWKGCKQYLLVDSWTHQQSYHDSANVFTRLCPNNVELHHPTHLTFPSQRHTNEHLLRMAEAKKRLKPWENITNFMRMFTSQAAPLIEDQSLDFIYLDARHDYCGVREDIQMWWPKLKIGGIFAGHDYHTSSEVKTNDRDWSVCSDGND